MGRSWIGAAADAAWPKGATPEAVYPGGRYSARPVRRVLVLQTGPNASVDYYLTPRLRADPSRQWELANLSTPPRDVPALREEGVWVVICRYINRPWIDALRAVSGQLAGVSFFADDDLPSMITAPGSPFEARLKVSTRYSRFAGDLSSLASEVWVSTPALTTVFEAATRVLPPVPFDKPRPPNHEESPLVVYHGTLTHDAERDFLFDVARRLDRSRRPLRFEVAGGVATRLAWAGRTKAVVRPIQSWPQYLDAQRRRSAAVLLAPLTEGAVNRGRAAVKVFDAARLGAVGLFADRPPYADAVRDGVDGRLLPMNAGAWAEATLDLLEDPETRFALARAAHARVEAERRAVRGLFAAEAR